MARILFLALSFGLLSSCTTATYFHGEATVGPQECQKRCEEWGMELSGMVQMGQYSSGCICKVKAKPATSALEPNAVDVSAVAGVMMQKQREEQQHRATVAASMGRP